MLMVPGSAAPTGDLPLSGRIVGGVHIFPVRVHWEDTDAGGIVYHASYLRFMERGRSEMLRVLGLNQVVMMKTHGINYVVTNLQIDYRAPARFDTALQVHTSVQHMGHSRLDFRQVISAGEQIFTEAQVRCAGIGEDGKPQPAPQVVRAAFLPVLK